MISNERVKFLIPCIFAVMKAALNTLRQTRNFLVGTIIIFTAII